MSGSAEEKVLALEQVTTVKKSCGIANTQDLNSINIEAVTKEAMISLLDAIERQEEEKLKLLNNNTDDIWTELAEAIRKLEQAERDAEQAKKVAEQAKAKLENLKQDQLSWEGLVKNDNKVLFYTGLPKFAILKLIFDLALKVLPPLSSKPHWTRKLDIFAEFLVTLVKL